MPVVPKQRSANFCCVCWKHAHLKTLVPLLLFSPAIELNPIGQLGELVRQAALLYDAFRANRHLTQGEGLGRRNQAEFVDSVGDHILGRGVLADDDVAALLVGLEHSNDLVWDVWEMKRRQEERILERVGICRIWKLISSTMPKMPLRLTQSCQLGCKI